MLSFSFLFYCFTNAQPGSLDNSFGIQGIVSQKYNLPDLSLGDVLLKNEKLFVTGSSTYNNDEEAFVVKYLSNGTPDPGFGINGLVRINFNNNEIDDFVNAFGVQVNEKVTLLMDHENKVRIIRLNADGTIDASFGGAGGFIIPTEGLVGYDLAVNSDGSVLVLGSLSSVPVLVKLTNAGALDNSFGTNGSETITLSATGTIEFVSMAIQSNGRIVLGGDRLAQGAVSYHAIVARLLEDGTPDNSFSDDGWTQPGLIANKVFEASLVSVQTDNKIVFGTSVINNSNLFFETQEGVALFRYEVNGSPDNTFGTSGKVTLNKTANFLPSGYFTFQSNGKFLLTGLYKNAADYEYSVIRLNTNGSVDNTYDTDGIARRNIGNGLDFSYVAFPQSDDKAVLVGVSVLNNKANLGITRLNENGSADNSYNSNGIVTQAFGIGTTGNSNNRFEDVKAVAGDKVLVCGSYSNGFGNGGLLVRYNSNGTIDNSFGVNGFAGSSVSLGDEFSFITILSDSKIVAAGTTFDLLDGSALIVTRSNADGTPDNSFGVFGKAMVKLGNDFVECLAMAVQPDGRIILSVISTNAQTFENSYALVKLTATGSLDNTFDSDGKLDTDYPYSGLATQPDNKLVASGYPIDSAFLETTRLNTNGSPDNTFNGGTPVPTDFSVGSDYVIGLQIITGGKIIVSGVANDGTGGNIGIARLNSNGTPDVSFSGDGKAFVTLPVFASDMTVASDGSIIFSGGNGINSEIMVSKVKATGMVDSSFATNGTASFSVGENTEVVALANDLQSDGKILVSGASIGLSDVSYKATVARLNIAGTSTRIYTFTGSGNWNLANNWAGGLVPPNPIPAGTEIIVNHSNGGQCILNIPITVLPGGKISVPNGKTLRAAANIILPAITNQ